MSTRETLTLFCLKTHQEVIGLIKKSPGISEKAELKWEYDYVYCSGQEGCGEKTTSCPFSLSGKVEFIN